MNFLNKYNLLFVMHAGFSTTNSCQTAMTSLLDKWLKTIDGGNLVGAVIFNLCRAFDLLIHKLQT